MQVPNRTTLIIISKGIIVDLSFVFIRLIIAILAIERSEYKPIISFFLIDAADTPIQAPMVRLQMQGLQCIAR